jgi:hypothetical protein
VKNNSVTLTSNEAGTANTANASVTVSAVTPPASANVPTLQQWALVVLALMLLVSATLLVRRSKKSR